MGPPAVVLRSRRGGLAYGRPRQSIDALGQSHSTADASLDDLCIARPQRPKGTVSAMRKSMVLQFPKHRTLTNIPELTPGVSEDMTIDNIRLSEYLPHASDKDGKASNIKQWCA